MRSTRREKSLSLLCNKFLSLYPENVSTNDRIVICLDHMAQHLDVERRRIYDIVNVLESVEILSRYCKNQYLWHGFSNVPYTLSKLKTLSVKSNFLDYTKALMASQLDVTYDLHQDSKQANNVCFESNISSSVNVAEMRDATTQTISISREEKSLGIMSQKFLMLFLTSQDGLVSINFAARVLLGDTKNDTTELGRFKTKIRRLYDIANVLTSIGLIKKYQYNDVNISKPAYKYIGPEVDVIRDAEYVFNFMNSGNPLSNSKHSLFDHFKRNLDPECNIPKFDVNTGILTSKDKQWKKQSNDSEVNNLMLKTEEIVFEDTNNNLVGYSNHFNTTTQPNTTVSNSTQNEYNYYQNNEMQYQNNSSNNFSNLPVQSMEQNGQSDFIYCQLEEINPEEYQNSYQPNYYNQNELNQLYPYEMYDLNWNPNNISTMNTFLN